MAKPIKETPVLSGKDSKRFTAKMVAIKPESNEEKQKAKEVFEQFKSIANFAL